MNPLNLLLTVFHTTETVLGGADSGGRFRQFEELCVRSFLILRKNVNLLLALFSLMVDCGIPELQNVDDLAWMQNALMVCALFQNGRMLAFDDDVFAFLNADRSDGARSCRAIHVFDQ